MIKSIRDCADLKGKYVLVRSSCNVPLQNGVVQNTYRLKRALPTLQFLREAGAKTMVVAHIGRDESDTLRPVFDSLSSMINVTWGGRFDSAEFAKIRTDMQDGDVCLVENIRQYAGETANDQQFAAALAAIADIYVDDAFDNIHRDHASMVSVPTLLPAYAGLTLLDEITHLEKCMQPESPSLLILGGAKFETKMPLVEKYLDLYDNIFVTGALLNDILKAKGLNVGQSLVSDVSLAGAAFLSNPKLIEAIDVVVTSSRGTRTCLVSEIAADEKVIDMGAETMMNLAPYIIDAKTILWNGPLGLYESGAEGSTHTLAKMIAASDSFSVLGGGDTVAAVEDLGLNDKFGFVSIGGGAMLTLLEAETTPALMALGYKSK